MLRRFALIAAAAGFVHCVAVAQAAQPHAIDVERSKAEFSVSHIWVANVTGTVPIVRGEVMLESGSAIPVSTRAVLDAAGIKTDEPDRDKALRSSDFFDVARFPQWTFVSTKIVPKSATTFEMDGDLTIHGVTRPERLNVTVSGDPSHPRYHAVGQIDRHAFGMSVTRLDPAIGAIVDVTLDVVTQ